MCESSTIFSGRDEHGGSRRTHPSSQPAHYAVRTRGGCSYKIATPGGKPVASGRGMWARRSRKAYSPGCSAPALRLRRSEEHTSELQSRPHLVCRLLLEKKKKKGGDGDWCEGEEDGQRERAEMKDELLYTGDAQGVERIAEEVGGGREQHME